MTLPRLLETVWTDDVVSLKKKKDFINFDHNRVKSEKTVHFDNMKT